LAGAFLAGAFLAGAFLAGAFLAGAFLAGAFLAGAFFTAAFLAGAFLAGAFLAGAFFFAAVATFPPWESMLRRGVPKCATVATLYGFSTTSMNSTVGHPASRLCGYRPQFKVHRQKSDRTFIKLKSATVVLHFLKTIKSSHAFVHFVKHSRKIFKTKNER
jgi:hypothetical protein